MHKRSVGEIKEPHFGTFEHSTFTHSTFHAVCPPDLRVSPPGRRARRESRTAAAAIVRDTRRNRGGEEKIRAGEDCAADLRPESRRGIRPGQTLAGRTIHRRRERNSESAPKCLGYCSAAKATWTIASQIESAIRNPQSAICNLAGQTSLRELMALAETLPRAAHQRHRPDARRRRAGHAGGRAVRQHVAGIDRPGSRRATRGINCSNPTRRVRRVSCANARLIFAA